MRTTGLWADSLAAIVHDRTGYRLQVFQGMESRLARIAQRRRGLEADERARP